MTVNANRFIAPVINPSTLPPPDAIETVDQEVILAERMAEFQERADEAGFAYDVGVLEFDPVKIDQEAHAHREVLMRSRVNSAVRAVLPAFAQGSDLDGITARANVQRLTIVPADDVAGTAAVMESDQSLLVRYLTSFATPAAGSPDGYIHHAIIAYPAARDIAVIGPSVHGAPGKAEVFLLAEGGVPVSGDIVQTVRDYLGQDHIKPLTDHLVVDAAQIVTYSVELTVLVPRGPAPEIIAAAARTAVLSAMQSRYAIGAKVYVNAIEGAAYIGNVLRVTRQSPAFDIDPGPSAAPFCTGVTINVEVET